MYMLEGKSDASINHQKLLRVNSNPYGISDPYDSDYPASDLEPKEDGYFKLPESLYNETFTEVLLMNGDRDKPWNYGERILINRRDGLPFSVEQLLGNPIDDYDLERLDYEYELQTLANGGERYSVSNNPSVTDSYKILFADLLYSCPNNNMWASYDMTSKGCVFACNNENQSGDNVWRWYGRNKKMDSSRYHVLAHPDLGAHVADSDSSYTQEVQDMFNSELRPTHELSVDGQSLYVSPIRSH